NCHKLFCEVIMRKLTMLIISLILVSGAHAAKDKNRPQWVDNPASEYNDMMYMSTVGAGDSRSEAEDNARANLAKIFSTTISAETTTEQRYQEIIAGKSLSFTSQTDQTDKLKVSSNQNLINIQIGKTWTDKLGQVYALAYLHRASTAALYEEMILENSRRILALLSRSQESGDIWSRYASLSAAGVIDQKNGELLEQLRIISLDAATSLDLLYNRDALRKQILDTGKGITLQIFMEGDTDNKVLPSIESAINSLGFALAPNAENTIRCNVSFEDLDMQSNQKYIRYQFNLAVMDAQDQQILSFNDSGREAHFTAEEAKARAIRTLQSKITGDFTRQFQAFLDSKISAQ
ncbi:MAG TPA: LPP20 family lipoprotein, partial [Candidatus Cloacimonadota bacterium]|nr:LPP20 family lipoprotein [Candidatus Cloacimonadota bacterium]